MHHKNYHYFSSGLQYAKKFHHISNQIITHPLAPKSIKGLKQINDKAGRTINSLEKISKIADDINSVAFH